MRRREELPELLAPAGDFPSLVAAVSAGADAVYVGGKAFSARAFAKNFDLEELSRAVRYTHLFGVKLYVTVNVLVYDKEMKELSDYAEALYNMGVDALICADIGAIAEIRRRVPKMKIHASTQMSVHNTDGAEMAAGLGVERVVLARELSRENIVSITENCPIETEVFLHGALCVCHSGQCLMSSLVGGRSGNRGECAQPCRLPYNNGKYVLSLTDLSLSGHIDELISSGVASLKIEGRMKSPEYVYLVTGVYRKLLDEKRNATEKETDLLQSAFSRGGFSDSYFLGKPSGRLLGVRSKEDKERSSALQKRDFSPERKRVFAECVFSLGKPSSITLYNEEKRVSVLGAVPTEAINSPLTEEGLKDRLAKMGQTFLSLNKEDIKITLDEGINLPPSEINALRREAALAFEGTEIQPSISSYVPPVREKRREKERVSAVFHSSSVYTEMKSRFKRELDFIDIAYLPISYDGEFDSGMGVYIPPVVTDSEIPYVEKRLRECVLRGAKCALVSNIGHIPLAKRAGLSPCGDFRLNITNSESRFAYMEMGVTECILSPELTLPMARDVGGGEITLGRIPLMITERCFMKDNFGCDRCGKCSLSDRTGAKFPMLREFSHRNVIFNSHYTYMGDKKGSLVSSGITHSHFIFSVETAKEVSELIRAYFDGKGINFPIRRIGKRDFEK